MSINPIRLRGNWDEGYAIDLHTISSIYIGDNAFGHPEYDTSRSKIGEMVYQLKYKFKREVAYDIIELIDPFLHSWHALKLVDVVIPVPPSTKSRDFQPVYLIAELIAKSLNKHYAFDLLEKVNIEQIKNLTSEEKVKAISGSILKHRHFKKDVNILLVDDLYQSGITLNEVCTVLRKDGHVNNIYVLTMTKTRG